MHQKQNQAPGNKSPKNGYTLVEVLVAAAILVIVITAAITALRKGVELEVSDNHRREARTLVHAKLEQDFDYRNYATVNKGITNDSLTLDSSSYRRLRALRRSVVDTVTSNVSGNDILLKKISVSVIWRESDNSVDSIRLEKWLANVQ